MEDKYTTIRLNIWELNENFQPDSEKFTQIISLSRSRFPFNGSDLDKQDFCKNEIQSSQLLSSIYYKIEVYNINVDSFEIKTAQPVYTFEDFGVEKGKRTYLID